MSSQTCPNCGWLNRASNRFCSNCGASMVPPTSEPTTGESAESLAPRATTDAAASSTDTTANAATASAFIPSGSGAGSSSTDPTQPVTYVVQRWNSPTPDAEV